MIRTTLGAIASLTLLGCNQAPATSAPEPASAEVAPAPAAPAGLTSASLVGRWGDNGDCTKDITFREDGTFASFNGGSGAWSLNGDRMTMSGPGGTFEVGVEVLNGDTLLIRNGDGSIGTSQRCDNAK